MRWNEVVTESSAWPMRTYLEANCLAMGMAIQARLGWPLEVLCFGDMPVHVVAKNPHGGYADVRGPSLTAAQVLENFTPLVPSWKPSFKPTTASEMAEVWDKNHSPELLKKAEADLERFWGADVLEELSR